MSNIISQKKICTKCNTEKDISNFFRRAKNKDGRNSWCKECDQANLNNWRSRNHDKVSEQSKRSYYRNREEKIKRVIEWSKKNPERHNYFVDLWHRKNKDKVNSSNKKYRENNPEKVREITRNYRTKHPEKNTQYNENRRSRKISNGGSISDKEWVSIKIKYGNICLCCGRNDVKLTMDHIVPLSKGGLHSPDNIQPLCGRCNSRKHNKTIDYRK